MHFNHRRGQVFLAIGLVFIASASLAQSPAEMKPYTEVIAGTRRHVRHGADPRRQVRDGQPRQRSQAASADEGPQHEVEIEPFWMGKHEVTWDEYEIWMFNLDIQRRKLTKVEPRPSATSWPTPSPGRPSPTPT